MNIKQFEFNMFGVNTYVVWDPDTLEAAIIDPGMMNDRECAVIDNFISELGLKVCHLINTHMHIDHILGDAHVKSLYDVKVEASPADKSFGEFIQSQANMFRLNVAPKPVEIDVNLKEGDIIEIGRGKLEVLHVPGHSPGSIVLYNRKDDWLISGDVLFAGSIGRTDLPGGNFQLLVDGINEKLLPLPDSTVVYPGHGPATTIGAERESNPFLR